MGTRLKEISVGSTAYGTWYLRIYEDSVSQSIANNQSKVTLRLTLRCSNTNSSISFDTRDAWIGSSHFSISGTQSGGEHNLGSTTITVNHASDGTGSYSYSFGIKTSYVLNGSGSGTRTLATIPRASSISSISGSSLGSEVTVNIDRKSSSFTHTVTYKFGSISRSYTGQSTSCKFTPPLSDGSAIPNSSSGTATITVQTYSGSTAIGSAVSKSFTLNLPSSAVPTISGPSISRVDNGVPSSWGIYVRYFSKANVSISGSGVYGSSISTYSLSGGGYSSSSSTLNTGVLNTSGTVTFTGTVKDSRGRTKSATASITVYDYAVPSVSITAERCNSDGSANPDGVYVKATATYGIASVNGKNSVSSRKIEVVGTSYSNTSFTSGTAVILGGAISVDKSYVVKVTVTDALGRTSTAQMSIPTGEVIMDIKANGKGVAFGKVAETDNLLQTIWNMSANYFIANNNQGLRVKDTSGNVREIIFMNPSNETVLPNNNVNIYNSTAIGGSLTVNGSFNGKSSCWLASQYSTTGWLGWYDAYGGTRKGWIGHDGGSNFNIYNEASGGHILLYGGYAETSYYFLAPNNQGLRIKDASGTNREVLFMSTGNQTILKNEIPGKEVQFLRKKSNGSGDQGFRFLEVNTDYGGLCPWGNGTSYLGTSSYRWRTLYSINSCNASSDRKLKQNIMPIAVAKQFIMNLEPVQYTRVDGDSGRLHYGFIAQDVVTAAHKTNAGNLSLYQACTLDGEYYDPSLPDSQLEWGLTYEEFIAPTVAALQETIKTTDNHEQRIAELEESNRKKDDIIDELKDRLQKLERIVGTLIK